MKKTLSILLVLVMILSLAACGSKDEETTAAKEETTAEAAETTAEAKEETTAAPTTEAAETTTQEPAPETTTEEETTEASEEDGQNPVMNFIGVYAKDRASIQVEAQGAEDALITVSWSSSAAEHSEWTMSGHFDWETLTVEYNNCVKKDIVYTDEENFTETVAYENGTGAIVFGENGTLTWRDDQENVADGTVFEFVPPVFGGGEAFLGMWGCGRATIEITYKEETETYNVLVSWSSSAAEKAVWQYVCGFDGEKLYSDENGTKSILTWDENGDVTTEEVYSDGSAVFELDAEGNLTWTDKKENAAEDMIFLYDGEIPAADEDGQSVGMEFLGIWQCDRASIEITKIEPAAQGETFRVLISWGSSASESVSWEYFCTYEEGVLVSSPTGTKLNLTWDENDDMTSEEVYSDGSAQFEITEDGGLIWNDLKESAGADMVFDFVSVYEAEE